MAVTNVSMKATMSPKLGNAQLAMTTKVNKSPPGVFCDCGADEMSSFPPVFDRSYRAVSLAYLLSLSHGHFQFGSSKTSTLLLRALCLPAPRSPLAFLMAAPRLSRLPRLSRD